MKERQFTPFTQKVYDLCKQIPRGKVSTYGEIARAAGSARAVRAVGTALKNNPFAPIVPCHRVIAGSREMGGFEGSKDLLGSKLCKKRKMLLEEGVKFENVSEENLKKGNYKIHIDSLYYF